MTLRDILQAIGLLASLGLIGYFSRKAVIAIGKALKAYEEEERNKAAAKKAEQEKILQEKIRTIRNARGILAKELNKREKISLDKLEILYLAAAQQEIHFDLATELALHAVPYPAAVMNYEQVKEIDQLVRVSPEQAVFDDDTFYEKFVTGDLIYPAYYELVGKSKRLYILRDISPSMFEQGPRMPDGNFRDTWARGITASLLMDAIAGNAEYLIRLFAGQVFDLYSARTREEAEKLLSWMIDNAAQAENTRIGNAILAATADLRKLQGEEDKINRILLITDGDDNAGLTADQIKTALGDDIMLHVITIGARWSAENPLAPYVVKKY